MTNVIKDVELLAVATKNNIRRGVRKLNLRKKYEGEGKLTALLDVKIWKYEIRSQVSDLGVSIARCDVIIKILKKL